MVDRRPAAPPGATATARARVRLAVAAALTLLAAATLVLAGPPAPSGARPAPPLRIVGAVAADGRPEAPDGGPVTAAHVAPGRYLLELVDGSAGTGRTALELRSWDARADALVTPVGEGRLEVVFRRGGLPVDTRFTFTLQVGGRS